MMTDIARPFADLDASAVRSYANMETSAWQLARDVSAMAASRAYLDGGYATLTHWCRERIPQLVRNLRAVRRAGDMLLRQDDATRERWLTVSMWNACAAGTLLERDPVVVLERLEAGASQSDIRKLVAEHQPDQHLEHEWRTVTFRVSLPVYEKWQQALHRAAYEACKDTPTQDDLIECLAFALINEPLYLPDNGFDPAAWHVAVHSGKIQCMNCRSRNRTQMDWHHSTAKSAGGHGSMQVILCRRCHMDIQPRWREWLAESGLTSASESE